MNSDNCPELEVIRRTMSVLSRLYGTGYDTERSVRHGVRYLLWDGRTARYGKVSTARRTLLRRERHGPVRHEGRYGGGWYGTEYKTEGSVRHGARISGGWYGTEYKTEGPVRHGARNGDGWYGTDCGIETVGTARSTELRRLVRHKMHN